ncbi:hypothetical protein [Streptomyces jeddahensis]|uniref:Uncharacterized protein n=1 Tax=Streptomyces jeddahensis TaxID=1716141 RepID=A0A177HN03_9ACTN|nr:hypothetical protein [Streptomyces jeddahensis]OAH11588.1 hypothetical protein STSP_50990 [Streptomyces jeddahensis]
MSRVRSSQTSTPSSPSPHQTVWARTRVDHGCFLLYDAPACHQDDGLRLWRDEDYRRMLVCTSSGLVARSAVSDIRHASVSLEVYDSEPVIAAEWAAYEAMECDFALLESQELQLQNLMGDNVATVWLGRRGVWRVRAHRRSPRHRDAVDHQEEWLFQLWPTPGSPVGPAGIAAIGGLTCRVLPPGSC